ncbi:MAG: EAL domain-containing protein [Gammaproteobacteria bacterium]|jgi:diguanylate cyclase (GGDEF)-like protein|nr:EAL domain-containing protein [Gammaproteobacteria bacterium]MBT3723233.1 EAL domain-containing protein [Gammaproteobacteria bacterium]MBT4077470.1 EAL domain-containing protein [Gammaproteobacteria bacterium]MBT4196481.1 EAL domain-containing protein [Gammaproteobacteria bacterium]MBT4450167.1 EAL domain-containing protein [Gammaproteobacteria bacterium]
MSKPFEKPSILIIDDTPDSITILNQILQQEYRVLFALNGSKGLSIARQQKPDLILLDVSMPEMDGYQVCRELKANPDTRDIPVIFVTARDQDDDHEMGFRLGAVDYLTKPVRPSTVKVRVKNQLQLRRSEELILHQALYDSLTNLPNRSLSMDRLRYAITNDSRDLLKTALLFIDLDNFKKINDTLGHDAGDQLLKETAARLNRCVRRGDTVGRLGGDEFIIILSALEHTVDAKLVADNIMRLFAKPVKISHMELLITVSIGISFSPDDSRDYKQLLVNADTAMYQSKQSGRNNYHLFNGEMNQTVMRRMTLENHLHHALEKNEFCVYYQPLIETTSRNIIGAEALIRWDNPQLGRVSPDEFIGIAEQIGIIEQLGVYVLQQACHFFKDLTGSDGQPLTIAVNVSPQQFRQNHLPDLVDNILKETGLEPEQLELEVTEGLLLGSQSNIKDALLALRQLGVHFSMDDFGTGYSSLSYLREFPFSIIKIDRSFISDLQNKPEDQVLVTAAIAMAHALDMKVIAEGVETEFQLQFLKEKQCDICQGYLFSKPVDGDNFKQLLTQQEK